MAVGQKEHHRLESPLSRRMRAMRRESCMRRDIPFDGTAWIVPGIPDQIQGEMRAMRCSFRFAPFGNNVLLTNDAGKYAFLTPEEFRLFVSDGSKQRNMENALRTAFCDGRNARNLLATGASGGRGQSCLFIPGNEPFHFSADESVQQPMRLLSGSRMCKTGGYDA